MKPVRYGATGTASHTTGNNLYRHDAAGGESRLVELVKHGSNVVLDYSFWSRAIREDYRRLLASLGVVPGTSYLATPRDVVLRRVMDRDVTAPNEARLTEEVAASYFEGFEPPTPDEGPVHIIR